MDTMLGTTPHHPLSRNPLHPSDIATHAESNRLARTTALGISALLVPTALGAGVAALTASRRTGLLAGGLTLAAVAVFRWQLQRYFTDEPSYVLERRIGPLEIRRYAPRVEAHTRFATLEWDSVREHGFRRLAAYIFGANEAQESLKMTAPVIIAQRARTHTMAFVMPPDRPITSLPRPDDSRLELVDVPTRRYAVLRYRGKYRSDVYEFQAAKLRELVAEAHLTTLGEPMFAGFDPPTTLPFLRRSEVWIELA